MAKLPRRLTMEIRSTLVGSPADRPRRRPTRRSSQAPPSDSSVVEASFKSESGTGGANGKRFAFATPATVVTTGVAGSVQDEGAVVANVTGLARRKARGGDTS